MDRIALETLRQELLNDSTIVLDAFSKAGKRMALKSEVGYEGCAHHLCRLYNAVEQMGLRVAKVFEKRVAAAFPGLVEAFIEQVKQQQGLDKAPSP